MYQGSALFYGLLTSFVLTSATRCHRSGHRMSDWVMLLGWALASASITLGIGLIGYESEIAVFGQPSPDDGLAQS
jgi:hypothetical protein